MKIKPFSSLGAAKKTVGGKDFMWWGGWIKIIQILPVEGGFFVISEPPINKDNLVRGKNGEFRVNDINVFARKHKKEETFSFNDHEKVERKVNCDCLGCGKEEASFSITGDNMKFYCQKCGSRSFETIRIYGNLRLEMYNCASYDSVIISEEGGIVVIANYDYDGVLEAVGIQWNDKFAVISVFD